MEKNEKIHLMQLVTGFSIGGAERKLLELIKYLDPERFDITICSVGISGPLEDAFRETGYDVFIFKKRFAFDFSQVIKGARLMRKRNIDMVMTTLFYSDIIGTIAAKLAGVRHVISWEVSSHPAESEESQLRHIIFYRTCIKLADKIIAVSNGVKNFLIEKRQIDPEKIETIHYGIDLEKYVSVDGKAKRKELGFDDNSKIVGVVARFTVQKGHTYLIDAAPEILKRHPQTKFVLVGDGPLRDEIEAKIVQKGLSDNFELLGFRDDVVEVLNTFDVFLLPSLFEGLPNVILEAMACARPIIATAVDGTPEAVIDGECGVLIPPKDPKAIADATIEMLDDDRKAKKMGENARKRVEEHFANDRQFSKIEKLYLDVYNK